MWFVSGCKQSSFALPWRTLLAYLVALNLLCPGSAKLRVVALNFPVTATVGQDVVLHCHLSPCKDARSLDIRWIQHRSSGLVHHYQNGEDLEQMEEYKGRTELLRDGLSDGNLNLHITAVSSSDSGSYMCTVQDDGGYVEAMVNLQVSDPFSHIVHPWKVALAVVLTLLFGSFVIIVFLHRKQAAQTKNLKRKDAVLEELPVILVKKIEEFEKENSQLKKQVAELVEQSEEFEKENSQLKKQVAELVEQIEEFEKENSQLKEHYMKMVLSAADLKKQVAELEEKVFLQEGLSAAILEIKIENQPHFPKLLSNVNTLSKDFTSCGATAAK